MQKHHILLLAPLAAYAQEFRATPTGSIVDPAGAAVPAVEVVLSNTDTGEVFRIPSDATGNYTFALMKPGVGSQNQKGSVG